jgi:hypothetical protein
MRASTAYFTGAGTILAAIAIGLGGGLVAGNIMHPVKSRIGADPGRMERGSEPVAVTGPPAERVQFLAGSQAFGAAVVPPTPAGAGPAAQQPAQPAAVNESKPVDPPSDKSPDQPAAQQASTEPAASPENALAKAKDAEVSRATSERRRAQRRQHWAERRRYETREPRYRTDWGDVARNVREDPDGREGGFGWRRGSVPPQDRGFPQFRWFGSNNY